MQEGGTISPRAHSPGWLLLLAWVGGPTLVCGLSCADPMDRLGIQSKNLIDKLKTIGKKEE